MYSFFIKRLIDVTISSLALLCASPILLLAFALVKLDSKGPILFRQERLGLNGKSFFIYKIRTMVDKKRIPHEEVLKGNPEVTAIGAILRRLKIDELPQLINVLNGQMSLIGPRPCLVCQLNELNEDGKIRLQVRPGLTGLAQVNGNIHLTWPERWVYDRKYVENQSLLLDLKIIYKTILIIIIGEGKFINKPAT